MRMREVLRQSAPPTKLICSVSGGLFQDMVWTCISKQRTLKVPSWVGLSLILWCSTINEANRGTTGAVISSHTPSPSIPLVNETAVEAPSLAITSSVPWPTPTPHLSETGPGRGVASDRVILLSTTITVSFVIAVSVVVVVLICVICWHMRSSKTLSRGMCLFSLPLCRQSCAQTLISCPDPSLVPRLSPDPIVRRAIILQKTQSVVQHWKSLATSAQ